MFSTFSLAFTILSRRLAVCRLPAEAPLPEWARPGDLLSATWTRDELSIVMEERYVPPEAVSERGWRALMVQGPLDFAQVGILAAVTTALADAGVSIFALSTYNTDYVMVREAQLDRAVEALRLAGHTVETVE